MYRKHLFSFRKVGQHLPTGPNRYRSRRVRLRPSCLEWVGTAVSAPSNYQGL